MALSHADFFWVMPDTDPGERNAEDDANPVWSLWADMSGTPWAKKNGFPLACIEIRMSYHRAIILAQRLYEIWGTGSLGITNKF